MRGLSVGSRSKSPHNRFTTIYLWLNNTSLLRQMVLPAIRVRAVQDPLGGAPVINIKPA